MTSYSPQLNPDERLNGDSKQAIEARVLCRTKAFFPDQIVAYAA